MYFSLIPNEFFVICAAIFGAAAGSFFHVCVLRIPEEQSIVYPNSHCPKCDKPLKWYDNLPIFSYIILRAKCRYCGSKIPLRYFIYEVLTAALYAGVVWQYHFTNAALLYIFLVSILIISNGIDWDHFYIPDRFSIPMIPLSIVMAVLAQWLGIFPYAIVQSWQEALLGLIVGGGFIWAVRILGSMAFQQEAMGFGDVKLMAYIGGFLGWDYTLVAIFIAFFSGSIIGVALKFSGKIGKYGHIPFGPYLAFGTYIALLFGGDILNWYLQPYTY